jgi:tartrate-resistant acid phosphatase type 5
MVHLPKAISIFIFLVFNYLQLTAQQDIPLQVDKKALNFIAIGDWGRHSDGFQLQVADLMGKVAAKVDAGFIISTGDNIYPNGVVSEFDPAFRTTFEDVYKAYSLQVDWYLVLGNHDYKSNPDAQVAYTKISRRWKMPARYYSKKFAINGDTTQQVLILFTDMNPMIPNYYKHAEYGPWVKGQDTTAQKRWMEQTLADTSKNIKWRIVVAHQPVYSGGGRRNNKETFGLRASLVPLFEKFKVDVYLTGHEHNLQHIVPKGYTQHFISGGGFEGNPVEMLPESRFASATPGFMVFTVKKDQLLVQTIDYKGTVIYQTSIKK